MTLNAQARPTGRFKSTEVDTAILALTKQVALIRWFKEVGIDDIPLVGGKNASLGEMYRELASQGLKVPSGFAVTAEAYRAFLRKTGLDQ